MYSGHVNTQNIAYLRRIFSIVGYLSIHKSINEGSPLIVSLVSLLISVVLKYQICSVNGFARRCVQLDTKLYVCGPRSCEVARVWYPEHGMKRPDLSREKFSCPHRSMTKLLRWLPSTSRVGLAPSMRAIGLECALMDCFKFLSALLTFSSSKLGYYSWVYLER